MTFAEFSAARRLAVFPEGEAEELVENHKKWVLDALIDLQLKIPCLQDKHFDTVEFDSTYWSCGASVVEAPRGYIHSFSTALADDLCSKVRRFPVTMDELLCKVDDFKNCGLYQAPDVGGYLAEDLPPDVQLPSATVDLRYRPLTGWYTLQDGRIWTFPALQSTEVAIIEWEGIKRLFADEDEVEWDREVEQTVEFYLEGHSRRKEDADYDAATTALAAYAIKVGDLIWNCHKERRLPERKDCVSNCNGCGTCATCGGTSSSASTTASGCSLQGSDLPEGVVVASPGCWYRRQTESEWEMWYKNTGVNTATGWVLFVKNA